MIYKMFYGRISTTPILKVYILDPSTDILLFIKKKLYLCKKKVETLLAKIVPSMKQLTV